MASNGRNDKPSDNTPGAADRPGPQVGQRFVYGPRQLGALIPSLVRPAFRRRAPATAQVLTDWAAIVGPAIAAVTVPRKLFAGTLAIGCSGPMALELQHLSGQLIGRINAYLGQVAVTRVRFVQDMPAVARAPAKRRMPAIQEARDAVAGLPADGLRDALEALGRMVLTRRGD
jgi:hypothetical protein